MEPATTAPSRREAALVPGQAVEVFLAEQQSDATRRAYAADLRAFFGGEVTPEQVSAFLSLPRARLIRRLRVYKAELGEQRLSEATVNRRLSTVRSLLGFAHRIGLSTCDGRGLVEGEKLPSPPQTTLLDPSSLRRLVRAPGTRTLRGQRDTAILHLLCENALRLSDIFALDVAQFSEAEGVLKLRSEGSTATVPLSPRGTRAVAAYLAAAGHAGEQNSPLFRNLDHRPDVRGGRITLEGLYSILREQCRAVGLEGLTPQRLRRSAIAAAIEASRGPVRRILWSLQSPEELSRLAHAAQETVSPEWQAPPPCRGPAAMARTGRLRRVLRRRPGAPPMFFVVQTPVPQKVAPAAVSAETPRGA